MPETPEIPVNSFVAINPYNTAKIYALKSSHNPKYYIGSTTLPIQLRFKTHKSAYNKYNNGTCALYSSAFEILKHTDAYIELIEEVNVVNNIELRLKEKEHFLKNRDNIVNKNNPMQTKEEKKKGFDFSGYGSLSELVKKWVAYKKSIGNSYKSQSSLDSLAKKLNELSGGDIQKAEAIVEQSIANQWQGLFALRQTSNVNRGNSQPQVDPSKIINYGKGNGAVVFSEKYNVYYEPIQNGQPPKEVTDLIYLDQGNHGHYGEYVKWMLMNDKQPMPPEDTRYFPADFNFEKFISEQKAILANSNQ